MKKKKTSYFIFKNRKIIIFTIFFLFLVVYSKIEGLKTVFFKINDKIQFIQIEKITERQIKKFILNLKFDYDAPKDEKKYWIDK